MTQTIPTERAALVLQMDAEYTPTTTDPARACANCRWYSELPGTAQCHLVVNEPEPINAGGGCNRHEPMPDGSAVITYMDDFGVSNPNNGNIPAGILADSIAHSEAALESLNAYLHSDEPSLQAPAVTRRFVDRAVEATEVEGIIRGFIAIWGNPECVRFAPGVHVSWGSGESLRYGRVEQLLPNDELRIELHEMIPGRNWIPLGSYVTLPKLDVRATDQHGTWFDRARPPEMGLSNGMHRRPIMVEHASDNIGAEITGTITRVWSDAEGIRFESELDRSLEVFPRIISKVQRGDYKTSSATMEHTAVIRPDGSFEKWILGEHTLTETPSENRMPPVTLIRSASQEEVHAEPRAGDEAHVEIEIDLPTEAPESEGEKEMTPEQKAALDALVAEFGAEAVMAAIQQQEQQPEAAPVAEAMSAAPAPDQRSIFANLRTVLEANKKNNALEARLAALEAERNAAPAQTPIVRGASRPGEGVNVNAVVQEAKKYARFSHSEMFTLAEIMRSANMPMSEGFARALAHRGLDFAQNDKSGSPVIAAYRSAFKRADDFMATDIAGQGTEWVGTFYGDQVWEKARHQPIMDALRSKNLMEIEVPDGASNAVVSLESSDPTFFTTAQANDLDGSGNPETVVNVGYVGTSSVTVTPGQLTGAVGYTDILSEDAVIAQGLVTQLNAQLNQAAIRLPEYVLINGDTTRTASTNINAIDGTPGTGINSPTYLVSDGALKLALVTNSAQSRDGGTLDDADFLANMNLMDSDTLADPDRMVHIVDPITYQKALSILAIKTRDVAGVDASLFNGRVPPIYGVDVLRTGQMALANSAGKIPAAGGTLGRILTMYAPYWAMVWKRRINFETARIALAQSNVIIVSMRIGFRARHATLSSSKAAAVSYNLTV